MAILKKVENEYGVDFRYHKLREARVINGDNGVQLVLTVYSWADKQARIDNKQPCMRQCIINGADFAMNPFYALLKAKFPEFSHGENDFDNDFKGGTVLPHPEFFDQTATGKLFNSWREAGTEETPPPVAEVKEPETTEAPDAVQEETPVTDPATEPEAKPEEKPVEVVPLEELPDEESAEEVPEENSGSDEEATADENTDEGDKE